MKSRHDESAAKKPTHHRIFIEMQNNCPLCHSQLEIRVKSYLEDFMIREEAHCPECEVLARVKDHRMQ